MPDDKKNRAGRTRQGTERWKSVLGYTAGVVILVTAVIMAWFFPEWYGEWQDERLMETVTLSSRESIEFIDVDSLDIAGRLKMLAEGKEFYWAGSYPEEEYGFYEGDYVYFAGNSYMEGVLESYSNLVKRCSSIMDQWWECGLMPLDHRDMITMDDLVVIIERTVFVDNTMLPVYCMVFVKDMDEEISEAVTVIMDTEKDLVYYAGFGGVETQVAMARELGYDSLEELQDELFHGETLKLTEIDTSAYDFASVCGAESAEVISTPGNLELEVTLNFETFDGCAYRGIYINDMLGIDTAGISVMFGTISWNDLMSVIYDEFAWYGDYWCTTDMWINYLRGTVMPSELSDTSAYDTYSYGASAEGYGASAESYGASAEGYDTASESRSE